MTRESGTQPAKPSQKTRMLYFKGEDLRIKKSKVQKKALREQVNIGRKPGKRARRFHFSCLIVE